MNNLSKCSWLKSDFGGDGREFLLSSSSSKRNSAITKVESDNEVVQVTSRNCTSSVAEVDQFELLSSPNTSSDLVVQKKKVLEVKNWLEFATSAQNCAHFLLITGPPGCGKHKTLQVLCKELLINIVCWEEPLKHFPTEEWENEYILPMQERKKDISFFDHLEEFFDRSYRYCSLQLSGSVTKTPQMSKKVLLLREFPPMIFQNLERWYTLLQKFSLKGKIPAVFILTDRNAYNSSKMKLFPLNLQEKLKITTINFSGLANSLVTKALQQVSLKLKKSFPNELTQEIVESCNGDLRNALNSLQWMQADGKLRKENFLAPKKRKLASRRKELKTQTNYSKDSSLDFMHVIGKILHAKRVANDNQCSSIPSPSAGNCRQPLKENVEELAENIGESSTKVLLYLHQNYPPFFNQIEDVAESMSYLSIAEIFSNRLDDRDILEKCSLLTAMRGLMYSNTSVNGSSWRPLRKPDYYAVNENQRKLHAITQEIKPLSYGTTYFSETLPFIHRIQSREAITPYGQKQYSLDYSCVDSAGSKFYNNIEKIVDPKRPESSHMSLMNVTATTDPTSISENEEVIIEDFDD